MPLPGSSLEAAVGYLHLADSPELSFEALDLFIAPENEVFLSSVSTWEIAVKHALGRLPLPEAPISIFPSMREAHGIESLSLDASAARTWGSI